MLPELSDNDLRELRLNIGWRLRFRRAVSTLTQDNQDHRVHQQENLQNHNLQDILQDNQVLHENNLQNTNPDPHQDHQAHNQNNLQNHI